MKRRDACNEFLSINEVNCCSIINDHEGSFSPQGCDCCNSGLGQTVYECNGYNPTDKSVVEIGDVCSECIQYFYNNDYGDDNLEVVQWLE